MTSAIITLVPSGFWIFLGLVVIVAGALVFYALRNKGDVKAVFSHGSTVFKLEAKTRKQSIKTLRR
jgi:hypothetical protein